MKHLRKSLKILLYTNGVILISAAMIWPIYALFVEEIWWDLMDASFAWWMFALSAWVTTLLFWKIADASKQKEKILALWYMLMGIWFFSYIFVDSIMHLFLVQIIIGLWEAIYSPAFDALYSKNIHKKQSGTEWGIWEAVNYFSLAIWAFLWWILVSYYGFNSVFIIMWVFCTWTSIYIYIFFPKRHFKITYFFATKAFTRV